MVKKKLINKVAGALVGTALGLFPLSSHAQDYASIQKGVNAPTYVTETPTHVVFHSNFNKDLERAIKSSSNPSIYLAGDKDSYVVFDSDTTGCNLYYSKKNFNEFGEGDKKPLLHIKGDEHMNPCDPNGLGSKTNSLVSYYFEIYKAASENLVVQEVPKDIPKEEQASSNYNITNIQNTTNTTNNYYADTTSKKTEKPKNEGLEFRLLLEANKSLNAPFGGVSGAVQLGRGSVWVGPYVAVGFGNEKSFSSTPVYHETLLNQNLQLFTVTEGIRKESARLAYPTEFGGLVSVGSKDGRVEVYAGAGVVKEANSTSDVIETGHDWMTQNGSVVGEKKPYSIQLQEGVSTDKYIPTQKIGANVHPFKKAGFYLGAEAQHRGKVNSKMDKINYNVKAGWKFGGKRR